MSLTIQLDGDEWSFREALGDAWRWYISDEPPQVENSVTDAIAAARAVRGWLPARVPGSVVGDLARHGDIQDPFVGRNSLAAEWTKERFWIYRRPVELPELADGEFVTLELDGVDPAADVRFDGIALGRVVGLFHRHRLVVPVEACTPGTHWVTITLETAPPSESQIGWTNAVTDHVPRMGYGWDFCPRLVHQGIWKSARLVIGGAQIDSLHARPEIVGDDGRLHLTVESVGAPDPGASVTFSVADPDGRELASTTVALHGTRAEATLELQAVRRWWPLGLGEQARHTVRAVLQCGPHTDEKTLTTGFREIEWRPNPGAPEGALGYTCTVNGRPLALAGWNWVPPHSQYGEIAPAMVDHLLDRVVDAGARILRICGVGHVESEHFFTACDERGILVWQEFAQSSSGHNSMPSTEATFIELMRSEAERLVPTLTHHPALACWAGGNELADRNRPLATEDSPVLVALREVCAELDPDRDWFATSPTGPVFFNTLAMGPDELEGQHDVHGPWEHQGLEAQHTLYNRGRSLAHTEFGAEGMANRRTLDGVIPREQQWPCDRTNVLYRHTGVWWINIDLLQRSFGGRLDELERVRRASQLMQATGLQYAVEADRRRSPRMSLVMPWQLNEPFPNSWGTCAIDFHGSPKPAFAALARAFADRRVTLRTETSVWGNRGPTAEAWLWSFHGELDAGSRVRLELLDAAGAVLGATEIEVADKVAQPRPVATLTVPGVPRGQLVVWRARWFAADGALLDDERTIATTADDWVPLLDLPVARLEATPTEGGIELANVGEVVAINPRLVDARALGAAGWPVCREDVRPLLPGERRTLTVRWSPAAERGDLHVESFDPRAGLGVVVP